jgi:transcriptional regulator with XRE-family HTH domain
MSNVHSPTYQRFLKKLRQARLDAELTQAQVSKALKKPQSFVSKAESGERRLDFAEVQRLAKLYGKPLSFFES